MSSGPAAIGASDAARRPSRAAGLLAVVAAGTILWSGVACAVGRWELSLWPWNRAWYMFSRDDGRAYRLSITGHLEDESEIELDLRRWFRRAAAFDATRADEVPRDAGHLHALALYVARRHNASAPSGKRVVRVTVADWSWQREAGRRPLHADRPRAQALVYTYFSRLQVTP